MEGEVTRRGAFSIQVCVPIEWDDAAVKQFADRSVACGTEQGWHIRKEGDRALEGDRERMPCLSRAGCVHVMLDA